MCGSENGAIAAFRLARGLLSDDGGAYVASQGKCVGRDGRVFVGVTADGQVSIDGECVTCINGELSI